jgi:hypothetical protein
MPLLERLSQPLDDSDGFSWIARKVILVDELKAADLLAVVEVSHFVGQVVDGTSAHRSPAPCFEGQVTSAWLAHRVNT